MTNESDEKALVVLEQDEVDILIHVLEEELMQLADAPVDTTDMEAVHEKLMVLMQDDGSDYQVK